MVCVLAMGQCCLFQECAPLQTTRRVDPYSLRLFVVAAQAGSIVRAAAQEHIAASALSRRLADLEHAFGRPLLVRSTRGVSLTDAGRVVLARGLQIDEDLQALVREVQSEGDEVRGTVRLYANMSSVIGFLPERLKRFMAAYPQVRVALHEMDTSDVLRACLDDRADVGVGVQVDAPAGLDAWHFAQDPLYVVVPAAHALAAQASVDFGQTLDHALIGIHQGGALDRELTARALALGRVFAPTVSVKAGMGVAVVPHSAAAAYAGAAHFARRPLAASWAARSLHLYALHRSPQPRATQALIDSLKQPAPG